jgi:hypothetical protein
MGPLDLILVSLHSHKLTPDFLGLPSKLSAKFGVSLGMYHAKISHISHSLNSGLRSMRNLTQIAQMALALAVKNLRCKQSKLESVK